MKSFTDDEHGVVLLASDGKRKVVYDHDFFTVHFRIITMLRHSKSLRKKLA